MAGRTVSQKTMVESMRAFRAFPSASRQQPVRYTEFLYERGFPEWFVVHAQSNYNWDWTLIFMDLKTGSFFVTSYSFTLSDNITGEHRTQNQLVALGMVLIERLVAAAATLPTGENVVRSLLLDGFAVNEANFTLVPLEGPVSAREEEDRLSRLVKKSGIPNTSTVLQHINDAQSLYADGKDHPSLNESRSLIQALIDGISTETVAHGTHAGNLPAGTANRIDYLNAVGFLLPDEQSAFKSAWGSLSAGSHPGVPDREQARIGLVLALEFGQLLLLKFTNWKNNSYQRFS